MTPTRPDERAFGLGVGSVCLGIAALSWWRGHPAVALAAVVVGLLLLGCGYAAPWALRLPNRVWWRLAQTVGWVNARIVLAVFFAIVLTPAGVAMRMFGRNPLRPSRSDTNWTPARRRDSRHYERLF